MTSFFLVVVTAASFFRLIFHLEETSKAALLLHTHLAIVETLLSVPGTYYLSRAEGPSIKTPHHAFPFRMHASNFCSLAAPVFCSTNVFIPALKLS